MAGKRTYSVVSVVSNLTATQAARLSSEIQRSKQRIAPQGRGTIGSGLTSSVRGLLQRGSKRLGGD